MDIRGQEAGLCYFAGRRAGVHCPGWSVIAHPRILERLIKVAESQKSRASFAVTACLMPERCSGRGWSLPVLYQHLRYIHTPVSMLFKEDWENLVEIVDAFIRSVHEKELEI